MKDFAFTECEESIKTINSSTSKLNLCIRSYAQSMKVNSSHLHQQSLRATNTINSRDPSSGRVFVSCLGKQLNEFYEIIRKIEEPNECEVALIGLRAIATEIVQNPWKVHMVNFMTLINPYREDNSNFFHEVFLVIGNLSSRGYDLDEWVSVLVSIPHAWSRREFVEATRDMLSIDAGNRQLVRTSFTHFLSAGRLGKPSRDFSRPHQERRFHRRKMHLAGHCHKLPTLEHCKISVIDLSPGGIAFEVMGNNILQTNDLITTSIILDGCMKKKICEFGIIKHANHNLAGLEFHNIVWDSDHNLYMNEMENSAEDSNYRSTEKSRTEDKLSVYLRSLELDTNVNINDLSVTEIRKAYYKALHNYHPDKYSGLPQEFQQLATRKTIQLNEAYHSLIQYRLR